MWISHQHTVRHGVLTGCNSCNHTCPGSLVSVSGALSEAEWAISAMSLLAVAYRWFMTGALLTHPGACMPIYNTSNFQSIPVFFAPSWYCFEQKYVLFYTFSAILLNFLVEFFLLSDSSPVSRLFSNFKVDSPFLTTQCAWHAEFAAPFAGANALGDHHLVEAMKHAFALRMQLGDPGPDHAFLDLDEVLSNMLSTQFASKLQ